MKFQDKLKVEETYPNNIMEGRTNIQEMGRSQGKWERIIDEINQSHTLVEKKSLREVGRPQDTQT